MFTWTWLSSTYLQIKCQKNKKHINTDKQSVAHFHFHVLFSEHKSIRSAPFSALNDFSSIWAKVDMFRAKKVFGIDCFIIPYLTFLFVILAQII